MLRRLTIIGAGTALAVGVALAPVASAAPPSGPDDVVVISEEVTVERVWVEVIGAYVDIEGVKTVSTVGGSKGSGSVSALLAGCTQEKWAGNPRKVRQSTAPYYNYVVNSGYLSLSSGCARDYIWMKLRQDRFNGLIGHLRDEDAKYVYAGTGREYLNVSYLCTSSTYTWYTESDLHQNGVSSFVKLCP